MPELNDPQPAELQPDTGVLIDDPRLPPLLLARAHANPWPVQAVVVMAKDQYLLINEDRGPVEMVWLGDSAALPPLLMGDTVAVNDPRLPPELLPHAMRFKTRVVWAEALGNAEFALLGRDGDLIDLVY